MEDKFKPIIVKTLNQIKDIQLQEKEHLIRQKEIKEKAVNYQKSSKQLRREERLRARQQEKEQR